MSEILNRDMKILVAMITSEIRSREDKKEKWAQFKKDHREDLRVLLGLPDRSDINPGTLMGFDIDAENQHILLNYSSEAHNILHEVDGGWTPMLRQMRGLIYSYGEPGDGASIKLISRGFEKFFNANELPENTYDALREQHGNGSFLARYKADGHMIEYFVDKGKLFATTRGKLGTASAVEALTMFDIREFNEISSHFGGELMPLIVELVTPSTEVHVDYEGEEKLYLLAAYDIHGNKLSLDQLEYIAEVCSDKFTIPYCKSFTLDEMIEEINDRSVQNNEGWVMDFNGQLIKFKYISYIGRMVESKLSYKYIMNCIRNDRLDKMLFTLPEEIRDHAYDMVKEVEDICQNASSYKPLYALHSEREGGESYFRTVCRMFWKEIYNTKHSLPIMMVA